jgi:UDP:flavonoid glycosyltransferase YjiC (YdhE family)
MPASARIILHTYGSFGDLHPVIALARALQQRGHQPVLASSEGHRAKVEAAGVAFSPVRPDMPPVDRASAERFLHPRTGFVAVLRELICPHLRDMYDDLHALCAGADLLISSELSFAAPLLAEKTGLRWASSVLVPASFMSSYDAPLISGMEWLGQLPLVGTLLRRLLLVVARWMAKRETRPVEELRRQLGLPPGRNAAIYDKHSPRLVLAMFSPLLGKQQPDWPPHTVTTGFLFHDGEGPSARLSPELESFLKSGPAPIVFTLGSSAVQAAGSFYKEAAQAVQLLHRRAVLLIGDNPPPEPLPAVFTFPYAPFSQLFPHAAAVVHQAGVGTCGQVMRAGVPALAVPFSFDQPDNAFRLERLGLGRTLARHRCTASNLVAQLRPLLDFPRYAARARAVGEQVRQEDGPGRACDAIEELLNDRMSPAVSPTGGALS